MNKNILIIGEHKNGKIKSSLLGILTKAKEFSDNISIVLLGNNLTDNKEILKKSGVKRIYLYDDKNLENPNPEIYNKLLLELINEMGFNYIFALASNLGKDLMPRIAAKLETGLASDCVDAKSKNEKLFFKRPIYAGKLFAATGINGEPILATFRPNILEFKEQEKISEVEVINKKITIDIENLACRLIEVKKGKSDKPDLVEADTIISGGRGVKNSEDFKLLEKLAEAISPKAVTGASRAIVDAGIAPHTIQVGQTGKTVAPKLYIACGISGAIQHLAGMKTSKIIVAINKDPDAPIFEIADYGIVGDLYEIVPQLIEEIKKLKTE